MRLVCGRPQKAPLQECINQISDAACSAVWSAGAEDWSHSHACAIEAALISCRPALTVVLASAARVRNKAELRVKSVTPFGGDGVQREKWRHRERPPRLL